MPRTVRFSLCGAADEAFLGCLFFLLLDRFFFFFFFFTCSFGGDFRISSNVATRSSASCVSKMSGRSEAEFDDGWKSESLDVSITVVDGAAADDRVRGRRIR